jgi:hypothetical protein
VLEAVKLAYPLQRIEQEKAVKVSTPAGVRTLYFDISLPGMRLEIECQGRQHDEPVTFFHRGKAGFERSRSNDEIKRRWCRENGHFLVEIPDGVKLTGASFKKMVDKAIKIQSKE